MRTVSNKSDERGQGALRAIRMRSFFHGIFMAFSVLLIGTVVAHASMCIIPSEEGSWKNYDSQTRGITRIQFRMECRDAPHTTCSGGFCRTTSAVEAHYFIHLFGKCHPTDCDWGEVEGIQTSGDWYYFFYDQGFAKRFVYVKTYPQWPGWLRLWMYTKFTDPSRDNYVMDDWFRKQ